MKNKIIISLCVVVVAYSGFYLMKRSKPMDPEMANVGAESSSEPMADTVTLASGLQYQIVKPAAEATVVADVAEKGKDVTIEYDGFIADNGVPGKKFDSSRDRGHSFTFALGSGQVIPGMDEGVENMKVGEFRRLIIPSALAYREQGAGDVIPANATLIFDVELKAVA